MFLERAQLLPLHHHLGGVEVGHELVDIVHVALSHIELARGDVEKADAVHLVGQMQTTEEVVLLDFQHHIVVGDARGDKLGDAALDETLGGLGVFQLLADGDTHAGTHEAGKVLFQRMVRDAGELGVFAAAGHFACEGDSQHLRRLAGVVAKSLVKVTHPEQQHRIGELLFQFGMLLHQRRFGVGLLCHAVYFLYNIQFIVPLNNKKRPQILCRVLIF